MTAHIARSALSILILVIPGFWSGSQAQGELGWQTLPNAPVTSRHNDVYFVTPDLGWIVNGAGEIHRTRDGGASWELQFSQGNAHFRSVGFVDSMNGWAGNVGLGEFGTTDPVVLRQTRDGGETWQPVAGFQGPNPVGICGMDVVNDSVVVAVGRVRGPAVFVRTTDRGETWTSRDMSSLAAGLIDVHFFSPDTGFAVGLTNSNHSQSSGVILFTSDGGQTWEKRFTSTRTGEWFWKMSFPSRRVGYVSLQRNNETPIFFVKTTDAGETWDERIFSGVYYFVQGIGFIDENVGWIGGNSSFPTYETRDGGVTWDPAGFGTRMNRVRFLGDTLAYAVGSTVYKYRRMSQIEPELPGDDARISLEQNHPNPFGLQTAFIYELSEPANVLVRITDAAGRLIWAFSKPESAGRHTVIWDGRDDSGAKVSAGPYIYEVATRRASRARVMHLVR
ncbi:MAG TPA: YCF48-related protein [Rhodothermales bacterium]|nr:YCF48-related protein [Rhodothermales bacterium]